MKRGATAKILVVDDNVSGRDSIEVILSEAGYDVAVAGDAEGALKKFNEHKPDLIIIERRILLFNDSQFLEKIQQSKYSAHIPIILISAMHIDLMTVFNRDIGRYDCISYPVDSNEVLYKVVSLIRHKEVLDDLYGFRNAFKASEAKWRSLAEHSSDIMVITDLLGGILYINRVFPGFKLNEVMGSNIFDYISTEHHAMVKNTFKKVVETGQSDFYESSGLGPEGNTLWYSTRVAPVQQSGNIEALALISKDITSKGEYEDDPGGEKRFRILFNQASDGILLLEPKGDDGLVIVDLNDVACAIHGYTRDELIGKPIRFLDAPNSSIRPPQRIHDIMKGEVTTFEVQHARKDGSTFPVEVHARMIRMNGKPYVQAIDRDVTERKRAENEILRMQRRLNAQWEIARLVDADRKTTCDRVLDEIVSMTRSEYGFYGFVSKDESVFMIHAWADDAMKDCRISGETIEYPVDQSDLLLNAIRGRKTLIVNDFTEAYPNKKGIPGGHIDVKRLMVVPIIYNNDIVAVGMVLNKATDYEAADVENIEAFLQSAQVIQDKKSAEEELQRHRVHLMELVEERTAELQDANERLALEIFERRQTETFLNGVNALLKLFPKKLSMKDYLESVIDLFQEWCRCKCIGIRVLNDQEYAPCEAYTGFTQDFWEAENWLSAEKDNCIYMKMITGKTDDRNLSALTRAGSFYCDNMADFYKGLPDEAQAEYQAECVRKKYSSVAVIPIRYRNRMLGIIHLADERKAMVQLNEVELLETLTPFIGEAVHKFSIEDELQRNCEIQRESSELLEQMFSSIHLMIAYMDINFDFIRVNRAFAKAFHKDTKFFIGRNYFELFPDEDNRETFRNVVETGESFYAYKKPMEYAGYLSKELTYWEWTLQPVRDLRGKVNSLLLNLLDVTQRKRAEADALRSSQLASLGELAAGVAHEINNPINGIINYSQILANKSSSGTKEHDIAARIVKEGDRIAGIVNNLLAFARNRSEGKRQVHCYVIVSEVLSLTGAQLRKDNITIKVDIPEELPAVNVQQQQIEQVLLNIISNARYALNQKFLGVSEDKMIEITGHKIHIDDSPFIQLTIQDKGAGIPADVIDKIMNPFFSTKPSGEGTGLGLSISQNIINEHCGRLSIKSVQKEFTRVDIILPSC